jgi:D-sedoheptulose 7-phosphate isomerase
MNFKLFKNTFSESLGEVDEKSLLGLIKDLVLIRKRKGRVFCLGVGGSAANAGHLVNDLRKLCNIEAYSASDNVSELTARINDEGWDSSYSNWLKVSNLNNKDGLFILSVGGGSIKKKISMNIVESLRFGKKRKCKIVGLVGRDGGYTKKVGDNVVVIKVNKKELVTPIVEAFQVVLWHYVVSHSLLKINKTKW